MQRPQCWSSSLHPSRARAIQPGSLPDIPPFALPPCAYRSYTPNSTRARTHTRGFTRARRSCYPVESAITAHARTPTRSFLPRHLAGACCLCSTTSVLGGLSARLPEGPSSLPIGTACLSRQYPGPAPPPGRRLRPGRRQIGHVRRKAGQQQLCEQREPEQCRPPGLVPGPPPPHPPTGCIGDPPPPAPTVGPGNEVLAT